MGSSQDTERPVIAAQSAAIREYRTADKSEWGAGPWHAEPDKRQWKDAATGLPCLIVRGPGGALCGYVGVSPGHPAHGLNYDFWGYDAEGDPIPLTPIQEAINGIRAHGGLTYADACGHGDNEAEGICHVPAPGEPDAVWWFGFDCAHYGDLRPAYAHGRRDSGVYRDVRYVADECAGLAAQLARLSGGDGTSSTTGNSGMNK